MSLWPPFRVDGGGKAGAALTWKPVADRLAAGDLPGARDAWARWGPAILAEARGIRGMRHGGGSWNIAVNAAATAYLYAVLIGDRALAAELAADLLAYCRAQLGPYDRDTASCLAGQEPFSTVYAAGVLTSLASIYDAALDHHPGLAAALRDLLRAHAYTLALFATARGPGDYHGRLTITAPGGRSPAPREPIDLEYVLAQWFDGRALVSALRPPRFREDDAQGVTARTAWVLTARWLSDTDRTVLRTLIETGSGAAIIVAELVRLGVRLVVPVTVERYRGDEVASWFSAPRRLTRAGVPRGTGNPHGVSAPTMAASLVAGVRHRLSLHPEPYDSGGKRALGKCFAWRSGDELHAEAIDASGFNAPPPAGVRRDGDHYTGSIPAPTGEPLYRVVLDREGVRLETDDMADTDTPDVDVTPDPQPEPPQPEPPAPRPDPAIDHLEAVARCAAIAAAAGGWAAPFPGGGPGETIRSRGLAHAKEACRAAGKL